MGSILDVAVLVGSLRHESFNRKAAHSIIALAPSSLTFEIVEIGQLPLYNQDLETATPPAPWVEFRARIQKADALLFVTPEYNRSVPAVLKNAIDVGSRPPAQNAWSGKPAAVVSVSTGAMGAFGANHHLRQSLMSVNVLVMAQPEAYIGNAKTLFDDAGRLINDQTRKFLTTFGERFEAWVSRSRP